MLRINGVLVGFMVPHPVEAPSYIIFKEGDYVKAKNGDTGRIDFMGTDAATVMQQAIDASPDFGLIFVKSPVTLTSITINKPLQLEFSRNAVVTPVSGYNTIIVASNDVTIRNLIIMGGGDGYRLYIHKGIGVENRIYRILLENIYIDGLGAPTGFGLYINNVFNVSGVNVTIERCGDGCVHIIDSADVDMFRLYSISAGTSFATRIAGCGNVNLFASIFDSSPLGLTLYNNTEVKIFGGITLSNTGKGIEVLNLNYDVQFYGHKIKNNGDDGIEINNPDGGDVRLIGVLSHNNGGYGFDLIACPNLFLDYCNGWANTLGNINNLAGAVIEHTPVYVTKNSGTATIPAGSTSVTVPHGLAGTPRVVKATPRANIGAVWVSARDATNITIDCEVAPVVDTVVDWEAEL